MKTFKVHFMGIAGSGASAVAAIAKAQGYKVSGCDKEIDSEFTRPFDKVSLFQGHDASHLEGVNLLAISPAITSLDPENAEIKAAKSKHIPVLTWQEFMGEYLERGKFVIAVCGTHGKSTTTAMIAKLLQDTGLNPTVELGAVVPEWKANYRVGQSKYFVTEADEFNDNFLVTHPDIAVVTSIEMDHPEYFQDLESYKISFIKFLLQTNQLIVANLADTNVAEVIKIVMKQSKVKCVDYSKSDFNLRLQVLGDYNVLNASAAFQVGMALGVEPLIIRQSLESYQGIGRRQEMIGQVNGAVVFSDFGHHPTEIKLTIEAIKQKYQDKKLILVFQPHMFSRTKALFNDFVSVLKNLPVEKVYVLDIFPSREVDTGLVNSKQLVEAIDSENVEYVENWAKLSSQLVHWLTGSLILIFQGAGSVDKLAREFVDDSGVASSPE